MWTNDLLVCFISVLLLTLWKTFAGWDACVCLCPWHITPRFTCAFKFLKIHLFCSKTINARLALYIQFIPLLTWQLALVCPEDQHIQTNQQNILIRSLTLKKQKGESSSKDVKGAGAAEGSRKRYDYLFLLGWMMYGFSWQDQLLCLCSNDQIIERV